MGRHSASASDVTVVLPVDDVIRPGSRRARRLAERQAKQTAAMQNAALVNASPNLVVIPEDRDVYAEYMNESYVISQVEVVAPLRKPRLFGSSRMAVAALVATASGLTVVATASPNTFLNFSATSTSTGLTPVSSDGDYLTAGRLPGTVLSAGKTAGVTVVAPVKLTIVADGKTQKTEVLSGTKVAQALSEAGIILGALDEVSLPLNRVITGNLRITVVRVTTKVVREAYVDEYSTEEVEDNTLSQGTRKVTTKGVNGEGTRTYEVTLRNGKEVARELIAETVLVEQVNEVVAVGSSKLPAGAENAAPVAPGTSRAIAKDLLASFGWGEDQFAYLDLLWQKESNWNHLAMNSSSGAYGIPQALPGSKMASAGADWATNPETQIRWGLGYIKSRYGSPAAAWAHSQAVGWY